MVKNGIDSKSTRERCETTIVRLSNVDFVRVLEGETVYYGGNQAWYSPDRVGVEGGCGPTAAANILAYLAVSRPDCRVLYRFNPERITKSEFILHMKEVYDYVTPITIPKIPKGLDMSNGKIPATLGIPFLGKFIQGVEAFASDRDVKLCAHKLAGSATLVEAIQFIEEGLLSNSPVALLNYLNLNLAKIPFRNAMGLESEKSFQMHWVTITSICNHADSGRVEIEVSSWGGKATLDLYEVVCNVGFGGLLYFETGGNGTC